MIKEIKITVTTTEDLPGILGIKKKVHENFVKQRPDIYKESDILYTNDFIESFFADVCFAIRKYNFWQPEVQFVQTW